MRPLLFLASLRDFILALLPSPSRPIDRLERHARRAAERARKREGR